MKISDFNYHLPKKLVANSPVKSRDHSRFLIYDSIKDKVFHKKFYNLVDFVNPGDLIVFNSTKVFPARLIGKKETGGKIEVLLLNQIGKNWKCLIGGKIKKGQKIYFEDKMAHQCHSGIMRQRDVRNLSYRSRVKPGMTKNLIARIISRNEKQAIVKFNKSGKIFQQIIDKIGKTPIPPYIKNSKLKEFDLKKQYQTVFANQSGSVAAPTAGLHFSKKLIGELKERGVGFSEINLNIGLGTFAPIKDQEIKNKKLHFENFNIPYSTIKKIIKTKKCRGKIIAVGTTTVRALETCGTRLFDLKKSYSGKTNLFIQPGFKFKIVDELITNFHLPKSSLMILVSAFLENRAEGSPLERNKSGRKKLLKLYSIAIKKKYRFYSFGDATMIK